MRKAKYEKIGCGDLETSMIREGEIKFKLGAFYSKEKTFVSKNEKEYLDFLLSEGKNFDAIYFHNGGKFDFLWLINAFLKFYKDDSSKLNPFLRGSRVLILEVDGVRFIDSMGVFPASLDKTAKAILGRGKAYGLESETLDKRCMDDCILLYDCLQKFFETVQGLGGKPAATIASIAMNTWQSINVRRYKQYREHKQLGCLTDLERAAYSGGRTEVFKKEACDYFLYDVHSMYPSVMQFAKFPVGKPNLRKSYCHRYLEETKAVGFAKITLDSPEMYIPATWVRRDDGKLIFPWGRVDGIYCLDEIRYFLEVGCKIINCDYAVVYQGERIFQEYVSRFYAERQKAIDEGNEFLKMVYKLFLNSLYGKFGEREEMEGIWFGEPPEGACKPYCYYTEIPIWTTKDTAEKKHVKPLISATVTALARVKLHRLMNEAPEAMIYCDTDSLHTMKGYVTGDGLGELGYEGKAIKGKYVAPKMYEIEMVDGKKKIAAKGFGEVKVESGSKMEKINVTPFKTMMKKSLPFCGMKIEKMILEPTPENEKRVFFGVDSRPYKI